MSSEKTKRIFFISISVIQFLGITIFWLGEKVFITLYSSSGSYEHFNTIKKKSSFYLQTCLYVRLRVLFLTWWKSFSLKKQQLLQFCFACSLSLSLCMCVLCVCVCVCVCVCEWERERENWIMVCLFKCQSYLFFFNAIHTV